MSIQGQSIETAESPETNQTLVDRIVSAYPVVFVVAALAAALVQVLLLGQPIVESLLVGFLVFTVGMQGLWAFLGHYFQSDEVATSIGWPTGNPFQKEIAFTNLAFGTLGVLCIWLHGGFWIAAGLGHAIFVLGAGTVHFAEIHEHGNTHPGNRASFAAFNAAVQVVILVLLTVQFA
ncbi:DUF6790 family protein [Halococcus hamelinensis]|uniref:DUF6790 family protein n=1 Tax=Halococcus hamelinensis TaxID=332168 RepID=UPI001ED956BB|nr:DUF6790 family protein [Halococcus hamelinensis]